MLATVLGFFDGPFTPAYFRTLVTVDEKQSEQNKINKFWWLVIQENLVSVKFLEITDLKYNNTKIINWSSFKLYNKNNSTWKL